VEESLSRIENGRANPSLNALEVIANGLGLDIFELFRRMHGLRTAQAKSEIL
jgi:transcriptional regulator with XRE-family HTH domain